MRNQRLVESLQTAEKVALFYEDQGYHQRSAEIFRNILETIKDAEANADKSLDLASLQISAAKYLDSVKGKAVQA